MEVNEDGYHFFFIIIIFLSLWSLLFPFLCLFTLVVQHMVQGTCWGHVTPRAFDPLLQTDLAEGQFWEDTRDKRILILNNQNMWFLLDYILCRSSLKTVPLTGLL